MTLREVEAMTLSELEHTFAEAMGWRKFVEANTKRRRKGRG